MGAWENRDETLVSKEELEHCLNCPYPECINCLVREPKKKRRRNFQPWEIELLKDTSISHKELAEMLERSITSIWDKRRELKVGKCVEKHKSKYNWTDSDDWTIMNNLPRDCADLIGLPIEVIYGRRRYLKWRENNKGVKP